MSLIEAMQVPCVHLVKVSEPDGEGGFVETFAEGETFMAAMPPVSANAARRAEQEQTVVSYTMTVEKDCQIGFHSVFRRIEDGKTFRVTAATDDMQTPSVASFQFKQMTAEEFDVDAE